MGTVASMLLRFALVLHFAAILITFYVNITFCGDYYILRRNIAQLTFLMHPSYCDISCDASGCCLNHVSACIKIKQTCVKSISDIRFIII